MKNPFKFFGLCAAALCFAFASPGNGEPKKVTVVIDAGHGGKDLGAAHGWITEKAIVSEIAAKIREQNKDSEVTIHLLRDSDEFMELRERVARINELKPDLVLSLHLNYVKGKPNTGMEFYICEDSKEYAKASAYAQMLSDKFEDAKFEVDGIKNAPFYILKRSEVPVVVFEMGYLSSETDREYLTDKDGQDVIVTTILEFIKEIK